MPKAQLRGRICAIDTLNEVAAPHRFSSMRLIAFNTGAIRTQLIDGVEVRTGYVKVTAPEPWVVTTTGAAGDEVAVHADHLYVFDRESYDYWARELDVPRETWADGHFAENLTVDTLDQAALRVGDRYRLGTATIVVTGPRVPCWKLTWRLGQPKPFMRRFRLSGRSGSYFGVIEPGVVGPGDELQLISADETAPSIAELAVLCDASTRITAAQLETITRALGNEHLSPTVRGTLNLKVANLERASADSWTGWRAFNVRSLTTELSDVVSLDLRPTDGGALPAYRAGQHVVVRISEPGATPIVRTWSLSNHSPEPDHYRISVKLRPNGVAAAALAQLGEQVTVELRAPAGDFHLNRGSFRPVVLIAAGIGITPMIAMIQSHLDRAEHMPPLWLLYGSTDPEHTAFREHLERLFAEHDDLHLRFFYSRAGGGRITAERVIEVMGANYLRVDDGSLPLIPWFESDIYLCGPTDFTATLREGLTRAGANPDLVFSEDFAAVSGNVTPTRHENARVRFTPSGVEATWKSRDEQTLLELAETRPALRLPGWQLRHLRVDTGRRRGGRHGHRCNGRQPARAAVLQLSSVG